ncbi:hypothetical protein C8Q77DRAFT_42594 [Trametes polyzona]|nr:hypothetical protein C8Q77DRAFT_42594 [Trametes polyzona]
MLSYIANSSLDATRSRPTSEACFSFELRELLVSGHRTFVNRFQHHFCNATTGHHNPRAPITRRPLGAMSDPPRAPARPRRGGVRTGAPNSARTSLQSSHGAPAIVWYERTVSQGELTATDGEEGADLCKAEPYTLQRQRSCLAHGRRPRFANGRAPRAERAALTPERRRGRRRQSKEAPLHPGEAPGAPASLNPEISSSDRGASHATPRSSFRTHRGKRSWRRHSTLEHTTARRPSTPPTILNACAARRAPVDAGGRSICRRNRPGAHLQAVCPT